MNKPGQQMDLLDPSPTQEPQRPSEAPARLTAERLKNLKALIHEVYLADARPWIIGYSGGKDSTTTLQLIWNALSELPRDQLTKPVYIISSDTLVETPVLVDYIRQSLSRMNEAAKRQGLPFSATLIRPEIDQTFWVNMIGRGYPAPYNKFRWCTDRLKINPANKFIMDQANAYGEVILVLGVRKDESATRRQVMELHRREGSRLSRHTKLTHAWVFTPIADWSLSDVWTYLLTVRSPWGNNNRDLVTLYKNSSDECPLVVDKTTPSCGNSRFGCWTCTVVQRDRSMENAIENGEEWMEPLLELRNWLKQTGNPDSKEQYRSHRRRSGRVDTWGDNKEKLIWGPYKMQVRQDILRRVLRAQKQVREEGPDANTELITPGELHAIRRLWRTEEGDWEDLIPRIYREETGEDLAWVHEEDGGASTIEEAELQRIAEEHELPFELLKELIDIERGTRGMARRTRIYQKLERAFKKDWRTAEEVFAELDAREQAAQGSATGDLNASS